MRFEGKTAIVTGGSSGIGLATAKRFASEGANVIVASLHAEKSEGAAKQLQPVGKAKALGLRCDVSNEEDVKAVVEAAFQNFGSLDVVVNNAGLMVFKPLEEQSREDWMSVLNVDLLGAFFFIRESFKRMKPGGSIVNISSIHAVETTPLVAAYAASKAALVSLTRSASLEGAAKSIRVNAVLPGAVNTPMLWDNPNVKAGLEQIDRGMLGSPEDIAAVIAFLASSEAEFVRGAAIIVDGGRLGKL